VASSVGWVVSIVDAIAGVVSIGNNTDRGGESVLSYQ